MFYQFGRWKRQQSIHILVEGKCLWCLAVITSPSLNNFLLFLLCSSTSQETRYFPSPNIFLISLLRSSTPQVTRYFPSPNIFLLSLLCFSSPPKNIFPSPNISFAKKDVKLLQIFPFSVFLLLRKKDFPFLNIFFLFLLFCRKNVFLFFRCFLPFPSPSFLKDIESNHPIILFHINDQLADLSSLIWSSFIRCCFIPDLSAG